MKRISNKNVVSFSFILSLFLFSLYSSAEESLEPQSSQPESSQPEWLKRIETSVQVETDQKPRIYFQTVQPLYQDEGKENTVFIQPRMSQQDNVYTYNVGFGYRKLASENLLLGMNVFGDYRKQNSHGRTGIGLEALGQVLEGRFNSYIGVTEQREVLQASGSTTLERVPNGFDYELGTAIPYMPWLKAYGSGFWYDFNNSRNINGWKSRFEARLNDSLRLEFFTWDDNKGDQEFGSRLRFNLAFNVFADILGAFKFSQEPFPKKDLREEMLLPVERHHEIVVEKFIRTSAGLTIEAGRS